MGSAIRLPRVENFYHFGMTFPETDSLRLVLAPAEVVDFTRDFLKQSFGIRKTVQDSVGIIEFYIELRSFHFPKSIKVEDMRMKKVLSTLIKEYYRLGWHLKVSMMLHEYGDDTSELIFERNDPIETNILCLSLFGFNKIRILGPGDVIPLIENAISVAWPYGMKGDKKVFESGFEIKLKKDPWYESIKDESKHSTAMMNAILSNLHKVGWIFIASVRTEPRNENLNALYFRYDPSEVYSNDSSLFAISFYHDNELHFTNAPLNIIMAMKTVLPTLWKQGVEKENIEKNIYEFKLEGSPWKSDQEEGIEAKRLICDILSVLRRFNWNYYAVCDLTRHLNKKSTLFFRFSRETLNYEKTETICISLDGYDKMRAINSGYSIINIIRNCIDIGWPYSVVKEDVFGCSWQFKLKGFPFFENVKNNTHVLFIMMLVLERFQEQDLVFICSADINGDFNVEPDYAKDLHSWYFASNPVNYKVEPAKKSSKPITAKTALGMLLNYKNYTTKKGIKKLFVDNGKKVVTTLFTSAKKQIISLGQSVINGFKPAAKGLSAANNLRKLNA